MMQIAMENIIFKTVTTLLFLPFTDQLVALVKRIIPSEEEEKFDYSLDQLDANLGAVLPSAAVEASKQTILQMMDIVRLNTSEALVYMKDKGSEEMREQFEKREGLINQFDYRITDYLIKLSRTENLTQTDTDDIRSYLDALKNYERIGDLSMNLVEFFEMVYSKKENFTEEAMAELEDMFNKLLVMFDLSAEIFVTHDDDAYEKLRGMEHELDDMELSARRHHFRRMRDNVCVSPVASSIYCDIIGTMERMGDHCCNVAKSAVTGLTSDLSDDEIIASTAL